MAGQFGGYVDGAPEAQGSSNGTPDGHAGFVPSGGGTMFQGSPVGGGSKTGDSDGYDSSTPFSGPPEPAGGRGPINGPGGGGR